LGLEKIGTSEVIEVKRHARTLYLPLSGDLVRAFNIKKGDLLHVEIKGRVTAEGGETGE